MGKGGASVQDDDIVQCSSQELDKTSFAFHTIQCVCRNHHYSVRDRETVRLAVLRLCMVPYGGYRWDNYCQLAVVRCCDDKAGGGTSCRNVAAPIKMLLPEAFTASAERAESKSSGPSTCSLVNREFLGYIFGSAYKYVG